MRYSFYLSVSAILIITAFLGGCAVKKMTRQAAQFEAAGMFKEAADLYYQAAMKKPQEVDYRIGLKRTGQVYLDEMSAGIAYSYNRGDHKKTVYDYLLMQEFAAKVKRAGIDLNINYTTQRYYENAKDAFLNERYESGQRFLTEQNYDEARKVFSARENTWKPIANGIGLPHMKATIKMLKCGCNRHWQSVTRKEPCC